jgi:hypothetical protein
MAQVIRAAGEGSGGQSGAEGGGAGVVLGAAVDRFAAYPPRVPGKSRPSGAVPCFARWCWRRVMRTGGMEMARMVPAGRCLRPRSSWLVPVLVQAAAVRGAAAWIASSPQPWSGSVQSLAVRATASSGRSPA